MFENLFSKKILESQICKISIEISEVFEIANTVIEFENSYKNKKKLPVYVYFDSNHQLLSNPIQFNVLIRLLMDANVFFKFYFASEPIGLTYSFLPPAIYEVESKSKVETQEHDQFQVVKIGDKPKNEAELEFDEIKQKFKSLFGAKDNQSTFSFLKFFISSFSIILSIALLVFSFMHLNPNVEIELNPTSQSIEQVMNIALIDNENPRIENDDFLLNRLQVYNVELEAVNHKSVFSATGKNFIGKNAKGTIEIYNTRSKPFTFVPYTRFQTEDGLIFRSQERIELLPGTKEKPFKVQVEVQSDSMDLLNNPIGQRGNLESGVKLFIPGLNADSKELVYAVTKNTFTGGETQVTKFIQESDFESARKFLVNDLKSKIPILFQDFIQKFEDENNVSLEILNFDESISISNIEIDLDESLIGKNIDSFEAAINADIQAKSINIKDLKNLAKMQLQKSVAPYNELTEVDFPAMSYRLTQLPSNPDVQILTLVISGIQTYQLDKHPDFTLESLTEVLRDQSQNDPEFVQKFLNNLNPISNSKVIIKPFWRSSIPNNLKNIQITYAKT